MMQYLVSSLSFLAFVIAAASAPEDFQAPSGKAISLRDIHRRFPLASIESLPHLLFEHDHTGNLASHFHAVSVRELASERQVLGRGDDHEVFQNGRRVQSKQHGPIIRSGNSFIFAFEFQTEHLLVAWGPGLELRPLDMKLYPGIFVNVIAYIDLSANTLSEGTQRLASFFSSTNSNFLTLSPGEPLVPPSQIAPKPIADPLPNRPIEDCSDRSKLFFEMAFAYDSTFCGMFEGNFRKANQALRALVFKIANEYLFRTCVQLRIISIDEYCDRNQDKFKKPIALSKCPHVSNCKSSAVMLNRVRTGWAKTVSRRAHRDAVFFFSGYEDGTPLSGATYKSAACDEVFSFAWIERNFAVVLAHEIGHMLGASHDNDGIMRPAVHPLDPIELSSKSVTEINKFVNKDPRSWCLRRRFQTFAYLQKENSWNSPTFVMDDEEQMRRADDMTFADLSGNGLSDLLILSSDEEGSDKVLSLSMTTGVKCREKKKCAYSEPSSRMRFLKLQGDLIGTFGLAFGNIANQSSKDIIVSHVEAVDYGMEAFYQVGYSVDTIRENKMEMSEMHSIPTDTISPILSGSITLGGVRSPTSNDLAFVHLERRKGKNLVRYQVGFGLDKHGVVTGGWSPSYAVRGWYGLETTGVSIGIYDIDGNGLPEVVVYHMDNSTTAQSAFFHIGRDMNKQGLVTGGWTEYAQVPKLFVLEGRLRGMMAISDLGTGTPVMAVLQRENYWFAHEWQLYFGTNVLTEPMLNSSAPARERDDISSGCHDCYRGSDATQCARDMRLCPSKIDDVALVGTKQETTVDSWKTTSRVARDVPFLRPWLSTIFCTGFHHLYLNNDGCDVFDEEVVLAKGVEQKFLSELSKLVEVRPEDYVSKTLFETPSGGTAGPTRTAAAAKITITGAKLKRTQILRRAVRKLSAASDWKTVFDTSLTRIVKRKGLKYLVIFHFNKKYRAQI